MIVEMIIRLKVNDSTSDKELNEIFKKYIDVMPCKKLRMKHVSDSLA